MKFIPFSRAIAALCLVAFASPAPAQVYDSSRAGDPVYPTRGQYQGTTTNDSASAGNVGELLQSDILSGSAISLVASTGKNLTSLNLTPGNWDVSCQIVFLPAASTNITTLAASISATTNTLDQTSGTNFSQTNYGPGGVVPGSNQTLLTPTKNIKVSTTTTYYCVAYSAFTVNTNTAYGYMRALRIR